MKRVIFALFFVGACKQKAPIQTGLTGLTVRVSFGNAEGVDQLRISGTFADGSTAVPENTSPQSAGAPLEADPTTDILFNENRAGQTVSLHVDGLAKGVIVGSEVGSGVLVAKTLVTVSITLGAPAICGDNVLRAPLEGCDDGNPDSGDGCSDKCQAEFGASCPPDAAGPCAIGCGNGVVGPGESCDLGGGTSPGCVACVLVSGWTCDGTTCHDANCGNSVVDPGEKCDNGNATPGDGCDADCQIEDTWTCDTSVTPSCCSRCGDSLIQCGEVCDGSAVKGATCLNQGHLNGTATAPGCNATCDALDLSACSGIAIDSVAHIQNAVQEAEQEAGTGPRLVSIVAGNYTFSASGATSKIDIGCVGDCPANQPLCTIHGCSTDGVVLAPLNGVVTFFSANTNSAEMEVVSSNNAFVNLTFSGQVRAIHLATGADHSTIANDSFARNDTQKQDMVFIESNNNLIVQNAFVSKDSSANNDATAAIHIDGGSDNVIAENVISGLYTNAILLENQTSGITAIDFNSLNLGGTSIGMDFSSVAGNGVCVRDNIIAGANTSFAYSFNTVTNGSAANCQNTVTGKNDVHGQVSLCNPINSECVTDCVNGGSFGDYCKLQSDPGFSATSTDLCVSPATNALIDHGDDLGYDKVPPSGAPLFTGAAPDIGAREAGASYSFGNVVSTCP